MLPLKDTKKTIIDTNKQVNARFSYALPTNQPTNQQIKKNHLSKVAVADRKFDQFFSIRCSRAVRSCTNLAKASSRSGMFKAESACCNASSLISRFVRTCTAPADKLLKLRLVTTLGMLSGSIP
jgi:hypothetical protein